MAALIDAPQAKITISPFNCALVSRRVTNFEGDTPEEAVANARKKWGWNLTIEQFRMALDAGLIVRHHRRRNRVRKGFRTLNAAERQVYEARLNGAVSGTRIPKKRHDLPIADCRKLARQQARLAKKETLQARTPLQDLIQVPEVVLKKKDKKDLRSKHPKWFRHPATDPLPAF
jgi:hypothetical protein